MDVLILNRAEVVALLDPQALLDALRDGFVALTSGEVTAPGRNQLTMPDEAFLLGMPGRLRDGAMTVKVVTVFEQHDPSHLATIGLYDPHSGACRAFMDGTYITAIRTSAAAAVATDVLAREDARTLAIVFGVITGTYSAIYVSSSLLIYMPTIRRWRDDKTEKAATDVAKAGA